MTLRYPDDIRLPETLDVWRHHSGALYTVVGLARRDDGNVDVVYTPRNNYRDGMPPLYTRPLSVWLQTLDNRRPRFEFVDKVDTCQYLNPEKIQ